MSTTPPSPEGADLSAFASRLDPPLLVVTATADGEHSGCLVGFATQAGIHPPRLLVCLSVTNHTWPVARDAEVLAVHLLEDGQHGLAELFGEATGDETDKFARCRWHRGPGGVRVLAGCGYVVGRVVDRLDCGDHVAHLLEPVEVSAGGSGPLLRLSDGHDLGPGHPA